jgi:hypothetical protein
MGAKSFILDAGLWRSSDSQEVRLVIGWRLRIG